MAKNDDADLALKALAIPGIVVLAFVAGCADAWLFQKIWGWYVAGFQGLPTLPFGVTFAVMLMRSFFSMSANRKENTDLGWATALIWTRFCLILLLGWVGTFFI